MILHRISTGNPGRLRIRDLVKQTKIIGVGPVGDLNLVGLEEKTNLLGNDSIVVTTKIVMEISSSKNISRRIADHRGDNTSIQLLIDVAELGNGSRALDSHRLAVLDITTSVSDQIRRSIRNRGIVQRSRSEFVNRSEFNDRGRTCHSDVLTGEASSVSRDQIHDRIRHRRVNNSSIRVKRRCPNGNQLCNRW